MRFLALTLMASFALPAAAQTAEESTPEALSAAYRCAEISEDAARLACYDRAINRLQEAETQGQIVAVDRAQAATIERDAFGFHLPSLSALIPSFRDADGERTDNVEMQVERVVEHASGRHSFIMSNGQVWIQVESQSARNVRPGDSIRVRRGALGSFILSAGRGASHRVRRES
ncbi:MAG: hypothetical protein ABL883_06575 [Terricaulis sp.]